MTENRAAIIKAIGDTGAGVICSLAVCAMVFFNVQQMDVLIDIEEARNAELRILNVRQSEEKSILRGLLEELKTSTDTIA